MSFDAIAIFFNQHSFVLLGLTLWLGLAVVVGSHRRGRWRGALALFVLGLSLCAAWLALRSGPGTQTQTAEVEALVGQGQPVLVEYYSDY